MLEVRGLAASYGKHSALAGVDLDVKPGEIVVMLGANGAGKSTLLKSIAGLVHPQAGSRVTFDGQDLLALPPHEIVEAGIALVPGRARHLRRADRAGKSRARRLSRAAPAQARRTISRASSRCSRVLPSAARSSPAP